MRNLHLQFVLAFLAGWVNRSQQALIDYLQTENEIYREKLRGKRIRFTDDQRRRLAVKAKALGRKALSKIDSIVTPDTLFRWYQKLIAEKYDGSRNRGPGRPRSSDDITDMIVQMAKENPTWGYTRIVGALKNLGITICRTTVKHILNEHGIEPAPKRGKGMSWATFIKVHFGEIVATDFFTVEVLRPFGLVRYYVLFVIDIETRRVHIAGIVHQVYNEWMKQIARNLTDVVDGFLLEKRYVIHDRDPLFTDAFRRILDDFGVKPLRLPAQSPNLNSYAERFILSIRSECLNKIILFSESQLRRVVTSYVEHYHFERPHQGLDNELIEKGNAIANPNSAIKRKERVGGLLNYYYREAA
ncbi:MAG: transposase [Deltaproteobacteria bacterium]|nr:transposase [Deltaproteobacteria bacterium]